MNIFLFNKAAVHASSINLLIHSQKSKQERNKISRIQNPSDIIILLKVYFFGVKPLVIFIGKKTAFVYIYENCEEIVPSAGVEL